MGNDLKRVFLLLQRVTLSVMGLPLHLNVCRDKLRPDGRVYLQVAYHAPCTKTGKVEYWKGRKWYLSEHMTDDEVIKTAYCAFEAAVKHEIMEGFKVDGRVLFNPHVSFEALLEVTDREVLRKEVPNG